MRCIGIYTSVLLRDYPRDSGGVVVGRGYKSFSNLTSGTRVKSARKINDGHLGASWCGLMKCLVGVTSVNLIFEFR